MLHSIGTACVHVNAVREDADLALGVVALGVVIAHTVVGLEAAHGYFCVSGPVHGPLVDVGRPDDDVLQVTLQP